MKTLITIFLAGILISSDFNQEDMLEYTGVVKYKDVTEVINLEKGKVSYVSGQGINSEVKIATKGAQSTAKIDKTKELEIIIRTTAKAIKMSIIKFEIEKNKRVSRFVSSTFNASKNKEMKFIPYNAELLNTAKFIYKVKINSKLEPGSYGIVFGANDGKVIPMGYLNTRNAIFFDVN